MNLLELLERFPDEEACLKHLRLLIWGNKSPFCPYCKSVSHRIEQTQTALRGLDVFYCCDCKKCYSIKTNTMFHSTHCPLRHWFILIFLLQKAPNLQHNLTALSHFTGMTYCVVQRNILKIKGEVLENPNFMIYFFMRIK